MAISKIFKNVGHGFSWLAKHIVAIVKGADALALKVAQYEPAIESLTAMVSPQAAAIEDLAFHVFGSGLQAIDTLTADATAAIDAAGKGTISIELDAKVIADLKALIPTLKAALKGSNVG